MQTDRAATGELESGTASVSMTHCPVCGSPESTAFYELDAAPVACASVYADATAARAVLRGPIQLQCCHGCGFVYNSRFDPALAAIGAKYESAQGFSPHFSGFVRSLARDWVDRYQLRGKRIVEVGCGDGEFMVEMIRAGVSEAIGIDPLASRAKLPEDCANSIALIMEPFNEEHLEVRADAFVCRHTLEHIQDVTGFLTLVRSWTAHNPDSVLLIEVPAVERVLSECAFWDVYYEHCSYFSKPTLEYAFRLAGFRVLRTTFVYDDQFLILEAVGGRTNDVVAPPATPLEACMTFGEQARETIRCCRAALRRLAVEASPVVIWQGASKTVGFMGAIGDADLIDCAVDINPHRQGRFLPMTGLEIHPPEYLVKLRPKSIVLMNPVYFREVAAKLRALDLSSNLLTVNQLYTEQRARQAA
jgi:Methyltransferase domain/C-methyltransferase C-terminal domain